MTTRSTPADSRSAAMNTCEENGGGPYLWNPVYTKGTAHTELERVNKRLQGLLPPSIETQGIQLERVKWQLREYTRNIDKYMFLMMLACTNQRLFYRFFNENIAELLPLVYTPTVGEACQKFHKLFLKPVGMYFSAFKDRNQFREMLDNWPAKEVDIIVVTDGGRILGLGDLGTNGMGISIGKISLYVAGGGFDPEKAMPVCLDCGTDNEELRNDPLYLGERKKRLVGSAHQEVVAEFCEAVHSKWPHCLIQFEDFKTEDAFSILHQMRDRYLCFNDDIQGTAAVVAAGFINGLKIQNIKIRDVKIVFCGAGSSGTGVAEMLACILQREGNLSKEDALRSIYLVDSKGLVTRNRGDPVAPHKQAFARTDNIPNMEDLLEIIRYVKPHCLLGLTGGGKKFTEEVIRELCQHCERPLIFPLSNPTSKAEITAHDAYHWSNGKCLFAAGSPFDPVEYNGVIHIPGQANNVFIFPGVGFGAVAVKATRINDEMLLNAAKTLANQVESSELDKGQLYPDVSQLRRVSVAIAKEVAKTAIESRAAQPSSPIRALAPFVISQLANQEY